MAAACRLELGLSPCPNDTFIFHALLCGGLPPEATAGLEIEPVFHDVQRLNELAMRGELAASKISAGVAPTVMRNYAMLSSGGALGFGCGPLLVGRRRMDPEEWASATIAVPGLETTASLLLDMHGGFGGPRRAMVFSSVMDAVLDGDCDLGVIIHEGRFTYAARGLVKQLDLGEWWESCHSLPLPLGLIAVRRDVPVHVAQRLERAIALSLEAAWANPGPAMDFARRHAQELSGEVLSAHVRTFVTRYSRDLGGDGRRAVESLVAARGAALPAQGLFLGS